MEPLIRKEFNNFFSEEKYKSFLEELHHFIPNAIDFRVAETPIFVDKGFREKILDTCEHIIDFIIDPSFNEQTSKAIPKNWQVPNETQYADCIAFDFGICEDEQGNLNPQLIEMQGFPSLFAYQIWHDEVTQKHWPIPSNFSSYLNGFDKNSYIELLKEVILGGHQKEEVILLEILPHQQKTRIDFYCTEKYLGIQPVCITELEVEGKELFYTKDEKKIKIKRIYNRVIFDELQQQPNDIQEKGQIFFQELDVEWCPHPNWFYRISKYTIPFIKHPYIPDTYFLSEIKQVPNNLQDYVLKPLFSFAGQGVIIDVTENDINTIKDPENWILQKKVQYAACIPTPDVPAKAEIRIFYFWKKGAPRPIAAQNLARLSKGKMIGVRYNFDKTWVGGTNAYFEK